MTSAIKQQDIFSKLQTGTRIHLMTLQDGGLSDCLVAYHSTDGHTSKYKPDSSVISTKPNSNPTLIQSLSTLHLQANPTAKIFCMS